MKLNSLKIVVLALVLAMGFCQVVASKPATGFKGQAASDSTAAQKRTATLKRQAAMRRRLDSVAHAKNPNIKGKPPVTIAPTAIGTLPPYRAADVANAAKQAAAQHLKDSVNTVGKFKPAGSRGAQNTPGTGGTLRQKMVEARRAGADTTSGSPAAAKQ